MSSARRFDRAYYDRYYVDPRTRVDDASHHASLVSGVVSLIEWFGGELRSVIDVGAGVGRWGAWLRKHRPGIEIVSTELEAETCARFGHVQRNIAEWRAPRNKRFDLVICQGVLPYLGDRDATAAIENLAAMSRGFFYLEAITRRDLDEVCDRHRTDLAVHGRTGGWYLRRLAPHFVQVGVGLFYARRGPLQFFELESMDSKRTR